MAGELDGAHWSALHTLLPVYQAITTVILGGGATTSFWFGVWHEDDCMADRFTDSLSHCKTDKVTVRDVAQG
jgi:hypothetical protein